jgi:hypothetical protein
MSQPSTQRGASPREAIRILILIVARQALLWLASDRVCGTRLEALMPVLIQAMERQGHLDLAPEVRSKVLAMWRRSTAR